MTIEVHHDGPSQPQPGLVTISKTAQQEPQRITGADLVDAIRAGHESPLDHDPYNDNVRITPIGITIGSDVRSRTKSRF